MATVGELVTWLRSKRGPLTGGWPGPTERDLEIADALEAQAADVASLRAVIGLKDAALREARDDMQAWGAYASDYFQEKHDLEGDLEKIDNALNCGD